MAADKSLCSNCQTVLPYTKEDYVICPSCGDVNWLGDRYYQSLQENKNEEDDEIRPDNR